MGLGSAGMGWVTAINGVQGFVARFRILEPGASLGAHPAAMGREAVLLPQLKGFAALLPSLLQALQE